MTGYMGGIEVLKLALPRIMEESSG
jgi:hypothetical protein